MQILRLLIESGLIINNGILIGYLIGAKKCHENIQEQIIKNANAKTTE